jgi:hypothetical protein
MLNLSVLTRKTRAFFSIGWRDKLLLLEALFFTGVARLIMVFIHFDKYKNYIGVYKKETLLELDLEDYKVIRKISWAIKLGSKYTPWESKCLVQALTAQKMLKRRKIGSTLYLGVNKDENNNMKAHSWLRSGQLIVTGGRYKNDFTEVARFGYEVNNKN